MSHPLETIRTATPAVGSAVRTNHNRDSHGTGQGATKGLIRAATAMERASVATQRRSDGATKGGI